MMEFLNHLSSTIPVQKKTIQAVPNLASRTPLQVLRPSGDVVRFSGAGSNSGLGYIGDERFLIQSPILDITPPAVDGQPAPKKNQLNSHVWVSSFDPKSSALSMAYEDGLIKVTNTKTGKPVAEIKAFNRGDQGEMDYLFAAPVEIFMGKKSPVAIVRSPNNHNRYFLLPGSEIEMQGGGTVKMFAEEAKGPSFASEARDIPIPKRVVIDGVSSPDGFQRDAMVFMLGGGIGTRIHPLTWKDDTKCSKPGLPVYNSETIFTNNFRHLHNQGFRNFAIHSFFLPESVEKPIMRAEHAAQKTGKFIPEDPETHTRVEYFRDTWASGSLGGLRQVVDAHTAFEKFNASNSKDHVVIIQGDAVTNVRVDNLLDVHKQKKALITLGVARRPAQEALNTFGVVLTSDGQSNYLNSNDQFGEKPKKLDDIAKAFTNLGYPLPNGARTAQDIKDVLVNTGIYVLHPEMMPIIVECYEDLKAQAITQRLEENKAARRSGDHRNLKPINAQIDVFDFASDLFKWLLEHYVPTNNPKEAISISLKEGQKTDRALITLGVEKVTTSPKGVMPTKYGYLTKPKLQNGHGVITDPNNLKIAPKGLPAAEINQLDAEGKTPMALSGAVLISPEVKPLLEEYIGSLTDDLLTKYKRSTELARWMDVMLTQQHGGPLLIDQDAIKTMPMAEATFREFLFDFIQWLNKSENTLPTGIESIASYADVHNKRPLPPGISNIMYAHEVDGYWNDVGNPEDYYATVKDIFDGKLGFHVKNNGMVFDQDTGALYWPNTKRDADKEVTRIQGRAIVGRSFPFNNAEDAPRLV